MVQNLWVYPSLPGSCFRGRRHRQTAAQRGQTVPQNRQVVAENDGPSPVLTKRPTSSSAASATKRSANSLRICRTSWSCVKSRCPAIWRRRGSVYSFPRFFFVSDPALILPFSKFLDRLQILTPFKAISCPCLITRLVSGSTTRKEYDKILAILAIVSTEVKSRNDLLKLNFCF
jgi:hypothetical protein